MITEFNLYKFYHLGTTSAGALIVAGSGVLNVININTPVPSQVIKIWDGTSTGGSLIASISVITTTSNPSLYYGVKYATGLFIQSTTGAADLTVSYI